MSVNPGFSGQKFIKNIYQKISAVRLKIDEHHCRGGQPIRLEVDGGIKVENVRSVKKAGADTFVVGSGIFGFPDSNKKKKYKKIMQDFRRELES